MIRTILLKGALTSKPYAFRSRSWEADIGAALDWFDPLGSNIRIESRGVEIMRVLPRINESINGEWISDKIRFSYDGLKVQRIDRPYFMGEEISWSSVKRILQKKCKRWYTFSGKFLTLKDGFAWKYFSMLLGSKGKSENGGVDCRESFFYFNKEKRPYLFLNVNPRLDSPIFYLKLRGKELYQWGVHMVWNFGYKHIGNKMEDLYGLVEGRHKLNRKNPFFFLSNCYKGKLNGLIWSEDQGSLSRKELNLKEEMEQGGLVYLNSKEKVYLFDNDELKSSLYIVYQGHHGDRNVNSELIIPCSAPTERKEYYLNLLGIYQKVEERLKHGIEGNRFFYFLLGLRGKIKIEGLKKVNKERRLEWKGWRRGRLEELLKVNGKSDYYLTDSLTRSSPIMSLMSASKKKRNFK